jgi:hypothetical protein
MKEAGARPERDRQTGGERAEDPAPARPAGASERASQPCRHPPRRPEEDVLPAAQVHERRALQRQAVRLAQRAVEEVHVGPAQPPGRVQDLGSQDAEEATDPVAAVALEQPLIQRPRLGVAGLADGLVGQREAGGRGPGAIRRSRTAVRGPSRRIAMRARRYGSR